MSKRGQVVETTKKKFLSVATALEWNLNKQIEKQRDRCTVCGQRYEWFQLDGSGRGPECQP